MQKCYNSTSEVGRPMSVKFGQKNPWPECNMFVGLNVMQGSTSCQFIYEYANSLINMQKCYNSTTKVGMLVKFG